MKKKKPEKIKSNSNSQNKKHVLLVEDEEDLLYAMRLKLVREGYDVTVANNGKEGLQWFNEATKKQKTFDLLITDIQMPDLTGTELMQEVRKIDPEVPTLVITGYGDKDLVVELMRLGCLDYLDKPFRPSEFLERVRQVLEKHSALLEARDQKYRELKKETESYESQLEYYRQTLKKYQEQFKSAKGAYEHLVQVKTEECPVKVAWKQKRIDELGGDYVDIKSDDGYCDILLADVSGHDMGASYHTVLLKAFFEENCRTGHDGKTFFNILNRQLLESQQTERMITALFVRLNFRSGKGELVSAGHPPMYRYRPGNQSPTAFKLNGDVLGVHTEVYFEQRTFELKPGDRYILYTDGIPNAPRIDGVTGRKTKLSEKGLEQLIDTAGELPLEKAVQQVWAAVINYCRHKPTDDMLLFAFEIPTGGE
jgi:phosphoserine phosphatase RsbU/P